MSESYNIESKTDEEIVELIPNDRDVFAILIHRYEDRLIRYVFRIGGGDKESVEDVVQNIFIKVYVNVQSFRKGQKFSSWIYGIAHNECIDYWRRNKKHTKISLDENLELAATIASEENIEKDLFLKDDQVRIREVIDQLPIQYKEVLVLRYLEEKEYQEMSDILRKPVATIGTLLHRAKAQLKKLVDTSL